MPVWSLYIHLLSWVSLTWTCVCAHALTSHSRETCKCCGCGHTEWPTSAVAFLEPSLGEYTHFWEEWFGNGESEGSFSDSCPTRGRKSVSCTVRQEPGCQLHFPRRSAICSPFTSLKVRVRVPAPGSKGEGEDGRWEWHETHLNVAYKSGSKICCAFVFYKCSYLTNVLKNTDSI